jgi:hypothetical protein
MKVFRLPQLDWPSFDKKVEERQHRLCPQSKIVTTEAPAWPYSVCCRHIAF